MMTLVYTLTVLLGVYAVYQWFANISLDNPRFKDGFMYGVCVFVLVQSLAQDAIGQSAYIAMISSSWLSGWITVPFAIISLLLMALSLFIGFRIILPKVEKELKEAEKKQDDAQK